MTLSTTTNRISYSGDGATVVFAVPFLFFANGDIEAIHRDSAGTETTWAEDTQYTLTGAGNDAGGTLTVKTTPTDYTPASGETLVIRRVVDETQETDYPEGGAFPASAHEQALDKLTMMVQQHSEEIARSILLQATSQNSGITVPDPSAAKFLRWNADADALENADITDLGSVGIPVPISQGGTGATSKSGARSLIEVPHLFGNNALSGVNTFTGAVAMTSTLTMTDTELRRPKLRDYAETVNAIGSIGGGTQDIDLEDGNVVSATVDTSATTFTFSKPPASGAAGSFTLFLTNGGSQTVNWPAAVLWEDGTAPTLTASGVDILTFATIDGGTTWYGFAAGLAMA